MINILLVLAINKCGCVLTTVKEPLAELIIEKYEILKKKLLTLFKIILVRHGARYLMSLISLKIT